VRDLQLVRGQYRDASYITEYFNVSDASEQIRGKYRSGHWNEELQADAIESSIG
jgi:hypothetical protein